MRSGFKLSTAIENMNMTTNQYFLMVLMGLVVLGAIVPYMIVTSFSDIFSGPMVYAGLTIPMFLLFILLAYPLLQMGQDKSRISDNMPLFITQMAALSTSELPTERIFELLSRMKEYGILAKDSGWIHKLIVDYGMGASEACRFVGTRAISNIETDFLLRLAHSLDVGERLERFLENEQEAVMEEYTLRAESILSNLEFIKEIFIAIITSLIFLTVFIAIIPMLSSQDIEVLAYTIVMVFTVTEVLFLILIKNKVPKEGIWYSWRQKRTKGVLAPRDNIYFFAGWIGVLMTMVLAAVLFLSTDMPVQLMVALICIPPIVPGAIVIMEEGRIVKRDNIFGAFIRSLGRSASVSGQSMADSVHKLSLHRFGELTEPIKSLSKRLSLNIDSKRTWDLFAAETNSNLIDQFSGMYNESTSNGASPERTSVFISNNLIKVLAIRKKRFTLTSNFIGIAYGVMFSLSITLWITIGIVEYIGDTMLSIIDSSDPLVTGGFLDNIYNAVANVPLLQEVVLATIVIHAITSSLMLAFLRGGHPAGASVHFVLMVMIGSLSSFVIDWAMSSLLG